MSNLHFTTKHANAATVQRQWFVVDGTNQTVGRMCAKIAAVLRGKHKSSYTPHVDTGDYIIVINCEKVVFTGNKLEEKLYDTFSGYPGGRKGRCTSAGTAMEGMAMIRDVISELFSPIPMETLIIFGS